MNAVKRESSTYIRIKAPNSTLGIVPQNNSLVNYRFFHKFVDIGILSLISQQGDE